MTNNSSSGQEKSWVRRWFQEGVALVDPDAIAETFEGLKSNLEPHQMTYLEARWLHMVLWWTQRAKENRWKYYTVRCIVILGGALIPALVSLRFNSYAQYFNWTTAGIGLLIAISAGPEEIFRAVSTNILHFSRELSFSLVRIVSQPRPPRLLRALLIGGDPKADDQSYHHGPSSATLRPPAPRACPPHR